MLIEFLCHSLFFNLDGYVFSSLFVVGYLFYNSFQALFQDSFTLQIVSNEFINGDNTIIVGIKLVEEGIRDFLIKLASGFPH